MRRHRRSTYGRPCHAAAGAAVSGIRFCSLDVNACPAGPDGSEISQAGEVTVSVSVAVLLARLVSVSAVDTVTVTTRLPGVVPTPPRTVSVHIADWPGSNGGVAVLSVPVAPLGAVRTNPAETPAVVLGPAL